MQLRSFFKSVALFGAGAAVVGPQIFIPKFEPVRWRAMRSLPTKECFLYEHARSMPRDQIAWDVSHIVKDSHGALRYVRFSSEDFIRYFGDPRSGLKIAT